jgi:hypothetical protein
MMVRPRSRLVRPGRREYGLAFGSVAKSYACGAWLLGLQVQGWVVWRLAAMRSTRLGWTSWRTDSPGGSWPERGEAGSSVVRACVGYSSIMWALCPQTKATKGHVHLVCNLS